jgi:ABC-type Fe3+ transport system permease subunit
MTQEIPERRFSIMRRILTVLPLVVAAAAALVPDLVVAAGGKAEMLIVVADKRVVDWSVSKWWVDLYNRDPFMFGLWCTIFTGLLGVTLGFITDQFMKMTGLDLTSRKIVEH